MFRQNHVILKNKSIAVAKAGSWWVPEALTSLFSGYGQEKWDRPIPKLHFWTPTTTNHIEEMIRIVTFGGCCLHFVGVCKENGSLTHPKVHFWTPATTNHIEEMIRIITFGGCCLHFVGVCKENGSLTHPKVHFWTPPHHHQPHWRNDQNCSFWGLLSSLCRCVRGKW